MARPSKLTDKQWEEIKSRMLHGEKAADLSREYKVSKASISERVSERVRTMKTISNQLVTAEQELKDLPVSEQLTVLNFVDDLKAISLNLASAGKFGAINANRLSTLANQQINKVTDESIEDGEGLVSLACASRLTDLANEASKIPIGLMNANKDQIKGITPPPTKDFKQWTNEELLEYATKGI